MKVSAARVVIPVFLVLSVVPFAAVLAHENEYAKIVGHLVPASEAGGRPCQYSRSAVKCEEMVTKGDLFPSSYYLYVVVTDGSRETGIAGVQFGIQYNNANRQGVDVWGWNLCATLEFVSPSPVWPASNGGNLVTWDADNKCQKDEPGGAGTGVMAVAGYFYVGAYSADTFKITMRPVDQMAKVADCAAAEDVIEGTGAPIFNKSHLGYVSFSPGATVDGYNPCGLVRPTQDATWSEVKTRDR